MKHSPVSGRQLLDLPRGVAGELEYNAVRRFADSREQMADRRAIYISNVSADDIRKIYDDRVASRILCGTWFELSGEDRRLTS